MGYGDFEEPVSCSCFGSFDKVEVQLSSLRFCFVPVCFALQPDPNEVVVKSTQSIDFYAEKAFKLLNVRPSFLPFVPSSFVKKATPDGTRRALTLFDFITSGPLLPLHHHPSQIRRCDSEGRSDRGSDEEVEAYEVAGGSRRGGDSDVSRVALSLSSSRFRLPERVSDENLHSARLQVRRRGKELSFTCLFSSSFINTRLLSSFETETSPGDQPQR